MLEKDATRCMNGGADDAVDLNEDKSINMDEEVKVVGKSLRSLSFRDEKIITASLSIEGPDER